MGSPARAVSTLNALELESASLIKPSLQVLACPLVVCVLLVIMDQEFCQCKYELIFKYLCYYDIIIALTLTAIVP